MTVFKITGNFIRHTAIVGIAGTLLSIQACSTGEGVDPGLTDIPIAYVKRTMPLDNNGDPAQPDLRDPLLFMPGGDLYIKDRTSPGTTERRITSGVTNGIGDVKDVSPSFDGKKILFSLKLEDPDTNDNIFFTWNIYEYNLETKELRRIITTDASAEEGEDVSPAYLPDGRIVFASDRQTQSKTILTDEGIVGIIKPQFSTVTENRQTKTLSLHVMNSDGSDIHQITFNQSHDLDPVVMSDGRILFTRWDNMGTRNAMHLYTVSPDGSDVQMYYGAHGASHLDARGDTVQIVKPQILQNGDILAMSQAFTGTFGGGDIIVIDGKNYVDINQPTAQNIGALSGPAAVDITATDVISNGNISPQGRYNMAYPLGDGTNRFLVIKGTCQLEVNTGGQVETKPCIEPWLSSPTAEELPSSYGIWLYDNSNKTEKPIVIAEAGMITTDVVTMVPRTPPPIIFDKVAGDLDTQLMSEGVGILNIRSVYDFGDNTFTGCFFNECTSAAGITTPLELGDPGLTSSDERPARFLRIVKAVGIPQNNDDRLMNPPDLAGTAFGRGTNLGMREIIGYAPIEPDGSVKVKVPANVAFSIEVLDEFARRIGPRHQSWLQVEPGDTLACNGCHIHPTGDNAPPPLPHGRDDAMYDSINPGAPFDGYTFDTTEIPNTNQTPPARYFGDAGDTMAEVRTRQNDTALNLSVDVYFEDVWTDDEISALDPVIDIPYTGINGLTTPSPVPGACITSWTSTCRTVINYIEHIDPIWQVDRGANTCINCHTSSVGGVDNLPDAQLDLTNGVSDEEVDHIESFRDLLFEDEGQMLDAMGQLVEITIVQQVVDEDGNPVFDAMGNPVLEIVPDPDAEVEPSVSNNGARFSYFMEKLTETELDAPRDLPVTPTVNHAGFLTPAELRLIAEWIDLGARYYNNPFDPAAPMN